MFTLVSIFILLISGLKRCIEIGLLPSTIFHYSHLEDPTSVDITQFVLSHASDDVPLKQMAGVFKRFGYLSLASSVTGEIMILAV